MRHKWVNSILLVKGAFISPEPTTSNCLRLPRFCEELTAGSDKSLLPWRSFMRFWLISLASAALFSASSVSKNCCTWAFCKQQIRSDNYNFFAQRKKRHNWMQCKYAHATSQGLFNITLNGEEKPSRSRLSHLKCLSKRPDIRLLLMTEIYYQLIE